MYLFVILAAKVIIIFNKQLKTHFIRCKVKSDKD
jgi:hypothetical protein